MLERLFSRARPEETKHATSCPDTADDRASSQESERRVSFLKLGFGLFAVICLAGAYWALSHYGYLEVVTSEKRLRSLVEGLGFQGIFATVGLIAVAIVVSPIPSGPIAMVAGAVYGPVWGGVYTVLGAVLGALTAFGISRCLGYDIVCRWLGERLNYLIRKRSQNRLMAVVFLTRLVPFISFDAVSYAAGLTPLTFWRFIVATVAGVIPISFLLTFFGDTLLKLESGWSATITILVGTITLVPILVAWFRGKRKQKS